MQQRELELKWSLTAPEHRILSECLAQALGPASVLEQDNRFYDSTDLRLRAARMNVRLRRENEGWVVTCKRKGAGGGGALHDHDEWEVALTARPLVLPLAPWVEATLAGAALVEQGGFANTRLSWQDGKHHLCLDATRFGHGEEHELEIETPDPAAAETRWRPRLEGWGVSVVAQEQTKFARFLRGQAG